MSQKPYLYEAEPRGTMAMNGGGQVADDKRKHYELIQAVVNRLATASFQIKGWTVTITTALLGVIVAAKLPSWVALIGLVPTLLFWCLDAYYLQQDGSSGRCIMTLSALEPTYRYSQWTSAHTVNARGTTSGPYGDRGPCGRYIPASY
jgi:hypothetical protein